MTHHWRINESVFLVIAPNALRKIQSYKQMSSASHEAGGLIYGYYRDPHIHLFDVTTPQSADLRTRYFWNRQDKEHLKLLDEAQRDLGVCYLGEWHTHPERNPTPSGLDVVEWKDLMKLNLGIPHIFIICGQDTISVFHGLNGSICSAYPITPSF
jgi:integrative and conjugative element protein (TIGR02256 family)